MSRHAASTWAPSRRSTAARELADEGKAVIVISSDLPEALRVNDRIVVIREGKLIGFHPGAGATEEQVMILATGVSGGTRVMRTPKWRKGPHSTSPAKKGLASASKVSFGRRLFEQREFSIFLVVLLVPLFLNFASPNF